MKNDDVIERLHSAIESDEKFDEEYTQELRELIEVNYQPIEFESKNAKIRRQRVRDFKAIDYKDISFDGEPALIYGENSAGKTSFLESI